MIQQEQTGGRNTNGQWAPGTSGNPAGRPAGSGSIVAELRRLVQQEDATGESAAAIIARQLVELAKGGDLRAIKECFDRLDGSPHQSITAQGDLPIILGKIVF